MWGSSCGLQAAPVIHAGSTAPLPRPAMVPEGAGEQGAGEGLEGSRGLLTACVALHSAWLQSWSVTATSDGLITRGSGRQGRSMHMVSGRHRLAAL